MLKRWRRKDIEKVETRDSVCHALYIVIYDVDTEESKVEQRAILTMKSLILAQDER